MELVPPPHDVRASDAEREKVATALRDHAGDGRLDPEELDKRLDLAYAARTRGDLVPLLADLPSADDEKPSRPRRDNDPGPLPPVIFLSLMLVAIWAMAGAGYFWPMWPIGAMLLASLAGHRHHHRHHRGHGSPHRRSDPS
jgi:hypothetical protein